MATTISAVDRITAEIGTVYPLTDELSIPFPTKKQTDDLSEKAGFYDVLRIVADNADEIIEVLDALPIGVFKRVMDEYLTGYAH